MRAIRDGPCSSEKLPSDDETHLSGCPSHKFHITPTGGHRILDKFMFIPLHDGCTQIHDSTEITPPMNSRLGPDLAILPPRTKNGNCRPSLQRNPMEWFVLWVPAAWRFGDGGFVRKYVRVESNVDVKFFVAQSPPMAWRGKLERGLPAQRCYPPWLKVRSRDVLRHRKTGIRPRSSPSMESYFVWTHP
ncbi:hypothetical protein TNCV_765711 [Trichonephila clavipes]|nr:hypothetical protein TNCV_765711 [Trichonephila clavipes]